jgi:predicted phosphodiesterase
VKTIVLERPFAVFSDVHGNLEALHAILTDIQMREIATTICLGDLVGYGPAPNEVALRVRDLGIPTLMGNYDQGIGFETGDCGCVYRTNDQRSEGAVSLDWTQGVVTAEVKGFLRTLEDRFVLRTPAGDLLAVHGSPRRINEYLFEDRPAKAMERMARENPYRAILFGHTHVPYIREVSRGPEGRTTAFVNVGSAGRPKDGDWRVCYAVVDPGKLGKGEPFVEFARVSYDYQRLLARIAQTPLITRFDAPSGRQSKQTGHD